MTYETDVTPYAPDHLKTGMESFKYIGGYIDGLFHGKEIPHYLELSLERIHNRLLDLQNMNNSLIKDRDKKNGSK